MASDAEQRYLAAMADAGDLRREYPLAGFEDA
jgi:hypothetical protein